MEWPDGKVRCSWANPKNERYIRYHDEVWGVPVHDDQKLFEMLILECFQAGLSWECVLNKQEAFSARSTALTWSRSAPMGKKSWRKSGRIRASSATV